MSAPSTIHLENVFYMLAYAFRAVNMDMFKVVGSEPFDNADDLLAAILGLGIGKRVKEGLLQTFEPRCDELNTLRGHLHLAGTIRNLIARRQMLSCEYDEFTANNLFNQILRVTLQILLSDPLVKEPRKRVIRKLLPYFSSVAPLRPDAIDWARLHYQRNNRTYFVLMNLCRLVIDGHLMGDKDGSGKVKLALFDEERLCAVYESFLREYYKMHHPEIEVPGAKELQWDASPADQAKLPRLITDVMLKSGNKVLIIDAKFYGEILQHKFGSASYRNANICQISTYVQSAKADVAYSRMSVEGMLLYAQTTENVKEESFVISNNKLCVATLDLNKKFPDIAKQLDGIVDSWK